MGGWLGVLFMIPLRRQLIVKEHGNLSYPEGTACADVLVAGERGGSFAGRVFWGLGLGGAYTFMMNTMGMWTGQPDYQPTWLPGASFRAAVTSEYLEWATSLDPEWRVVCLPAECFPGWCSTRPSNFLVRCLLLRRCIQAPCPLR